jgi:hypothetical protein
MKPEKFYRKIMGREDFRGDVNTLLTGEFYKRVHARELPKEPFARKVCKKADDTEVEISYALAPMRGIKDVFNLYGTHSGIEYTPVLILGANRQPALVCTLNYLRTIEFYEGDTLELDDKYEKILQKNYLKSKTACRVDEKNIHLVSDKESLTEGGGICTRMGMDSKELDRRFEEVSTNKPRRKKR